MTTVEMVCTGDFPRRDDHDEHSVATFARTPTGWEVTSLPAEVVGTVEIVEFGHGWQPTTAVVDEDEFWTLGVQPYLRCSTCGWARRLSRATLAGVLDVVAPAATGPVDVARVPWDVVARAVDRAGDR